MHYISQVKTIEFFFQEQNLLLYSNFTIFLLQNIK